MPVNITMELVQQLMGQNAALLKQNTVLTNQVDELTATVRELNKTIKELKEQLNIKNMVARCADSLEPTYEKIRRSMAGLELMHCDETGTGIDGKTWWIHNASDKGHTFLSVNRKRGRIGMDAAGILSDFHGIIVHDCWGFSWKYQDAIHAVCCAHFLWELNRVEENHPEQKWATQFKELLIAMKKVKDKVLAAGKDEVSYYHLHKFDKQYDESIKITYEENPLQEPAAKRLNSYQERFYYTELCIFKYCCSGQEREYTENSRFIAGNVDGYEGNRRTNPVWRHFFVRRKLSGVKKGLSGTCGNNC